MRKAPLRKPIFSRLLFFLSLGYRSLKIRYVLRVAIAASDQLVILLLVVVFLRLAYSYVFCSAKSSFAFWIARISAGSEVMI